MITLGEHTISCDKGAVTKPVNRVFDISVYHLRNIIDTIIDECVDDKYTEDIETEVLKRFSEGCGLVAKDSRHYWRSETTMWQLDYKPDTKVEYKFCVDVTDCLKVMKRHIKQRIHSQYPHCFKKGRLQYTGNNIEKYIEEQTEKGKEQYARRVASTPHSVKLKKKLRSDNVQAIQQAVWAVVSTNYRVVSIAPSYIKTHLKEKYDVDCGVPLNKHELAEEAYDFVVSHILINENYLKTS